MSERDSERRHRRYCAAPQVDDTIGAGKAGTPQEPPEVYSNMPAAKAKSTAGKKRILKYRASGIASDTTGGIVLHRR